MGDYFERLEVLNRLRAAAKSCKIADRKMVPLDFRIVFLGSPCYITAGYDRWHIFLINSNFLTSKSWRVKGKNISPEEALNNERIPLDVKNFIVFNINEFKK